MLRHCFIGLFVLLAAWLEPIHAMTTDEGSHCIDLPGEPGASGTLCGAKVHQGGAYVFKGIRYAVAERWTAARQIKTYENRQSATNFGAICPQLDATSAISEDCLFLNIWVPSDRDSGVGLPVMVFIHGGDFIYGAGSNPIYDGSTFARDQGLIVVTINYRLGALGFLPVSPDGNDPVQGGNFGIGDQITALSWVRDNIAAFGGDPDKVTIVGESAGAMSVGLHLMSSPGSSDLFRAGIQESNVLSYRYRNKEQARKNLEGFIGCLNALRIDPGKTSCEHDSSDWPETEPSLHQILATQELFSATSFEPQVMAYGIPGMLPFAPVIDGRFLTNQPTIVSAKDLNKPAMFVFNKDEGVIFADTMGPRTPKALEQSLSLFFGKARTAEILAQPRYDPKTLSPDYGLSTAAQTAYSNYFTDFMVQCPNMGVSRSNTEFHENSDVWVFEFSQPAATNTIPDKYDPNDVCAADNPWKNSCHSSELPFVFGTLDQRADSQDWQLSKQMNTGWANFVRDPNQGPQISDCLPWSWNDGPANAPCPLVNPAKAKPETPLFKQANCSFWLE